MCWTLFKNVDPPRNSSPPLASQAGYGPGFNQAEDRTIATK